MKDYKNVQEAVEDISIRDLAVLLEYSESMACRVKAGTQKINSYRARKIANHLGCALIVDESGEFRFGSG